MYDFQDSTDIFVNPSWIPELALKTGILVPKVTYEYDPTELKIKP